MTATPAASAQGLERILCLVVLLIVLAATLYAAWVAISNYPRIAV